VKILLKTIEKESWNILLSKQAAQSIREWLISKRHGPQVFQTEPAIHKSST
jgi:hypothetical protein